MPGVIQNVSNLVDIGVVDAKVPLRTRPQRGNTPVLPGAIRQRDHGV